MVLFIFNQDPNSLSEEPHSFPSNTQGCLLSTVVQKLNSEKNPVERVKICSFWKFSVEELQCAVVALRASETHKFQPLLPPGILNALDRFNKQPQTSPNIPTLGSDCRIRSLCFYSPKNTHESHKILLYFVFSKVENPSLKNLLFI